MEPVPGREGAEVTSRVALPRAPSEIPPMMDIPRKESEWRRPRIEGRDVARYGPTPECLGCRAFNRGQGAKNHTEACRARMEANMTKGDDPRITRYNQRIVQASMKFMKESEEPVPSDPGMSTAPPVHGGGNTNTGIADEDADMQEVPMQGSPRREDQGEATNSGNHDGSRHARERTVKRQGEELSEELDRATKWIREESPAHKRVIEEPAVPEEAKRSRPMGTDEGTYLGMICDLHRMLSTQLIYY